jgi:hypothetical protein
VPLTIVGGVRELLALDGALLGDPSTSSLATAMSRLRVTLFAAVLLALVGYGWWLHPTRQAASPYACARGPDSLECVAQSKVVLPCPNSAVRITMNSTAVTLNGRFIRGADMHEALASIRPTPTAVCLYHVKPVAGESLRPTPGTIAAITAIHGLQLPMYSYTDATFQTAWITQ